MLGGIIDFVSACKDSSLDRRYVYKVNVNFGNYRTITRCERVISILSDDHLTDDDIKKYTRNFIVYNGTDKEKEEIKKGIEILSYERRPEPWRQTFSRYLKK